MQQERIIGLWHQFLATVHRVAGETQNPDVLIRLPQKQLDPGVTATMLRSYFCVPMNCGAVNSLNCKAFGGPIQFAPDVQTDLDAILSSFTGTGPSAQVWWPLLELAEACNPVGINVDAARLHLQQFMPPGTVTLQKNAPMSSMNLDNILSNVMNAIPHVQDTLSKVINSTREDPNNMNSVIDHVQTNLLRPLLEGMGNQATLEPAVNQILDGFRGLSQVMQQPKPVPPLALDCSQMKD